jgi:uncharacterized protein involved in type VI secretion and phage assembly
MNQTGEHPRYYGKYRAIVMNNIDVMQEGKILVELPDVLPITSTWAMPCVPISGVQCGFFMLPAIGAKVWIEFEQGDLDYPIWVGGFWGSAADVPALALIPAPPPGQVFCLQTQMQTTLLLSDLPAPTGGIMLKTTQGATVLINDATGITIQNGKGATITMLGPAITIAAPTINLAGAAVNIDGAAVTINKGALVVT